MTNLKTKATTIITRAFKANGYWYVKRKDFNITEIKVDLRAGERITCIAGIWDGGVCTAKAMFMYYVDTHTLHVGNIPEAQDADIND